MKRKLKLGKVGVLLMAALFFMSSCDSDDDKKWTATVDPVLTLSADKIHSKPGRTFTIEGRIEDEVGIKSISLKIDEWYLDKVIELNKDDAIIKAYDLNYSFLIPESAEDKEFEIDVAVTNLGGLITSKTLKVFMDGDFVDPVLQVSSPVDGLTIEPTEETPLDLLCTISDDRQLGYLIVEEENLNFYDSISFVGMGVSLYDYAQTVMLPAEKQSYHFNFTVADSAGLLVTTMRTVEASFVYQKMYLADVETDAELVSDLFGVPMLIETTGSNTFVAEYYSAAANTEVKFIPQTSSFDPHCFGIDPSNSEKLIDSREALPIILPEVGYYRINIDVNELTFSVEKFVPDYWFFESKTEFPDDDDYINSTWVGELGIVGKGFPEYPDQNWSTGNPVTFDRDPDNLYRFTKTLDMEGTVEMIFQPQHPWGWWPDPFWRFDRSVDPEMTVLKGGNNVTMEVPSRIRYTITFDSYLNRAKAVKVD
ncbi:hypothetical protein [Saccharicrinis fermentans]|uniref:Uncharacterized protein n=1 Tax=Saccharicrinis fermentans DSM 9555 = JCM 21142 TaxID=869213 RepID=W7Y3M9_9BACT|nr:hypothetical protein [Saccharicrinis fermentans]GAF02183.1 hypothetical protein JCM21142_3811 [Saccharicrinis fermentans DSM 9555 = JCM 21142]